MYFSEIYPEQISEWIAYDVRERVNIVGLKGKEESLLYFSHKVNSNQQLVFFLILRKDDMELPISNQHRQFNR